MELKKGMYVRFNGFISKIGHINTSKKGNTYVQFKQPNGLLAHTRIENIDRASFNLIDLIKVGDYVNGEKVTSAEPVDEKDTERYLGFGDYDYYIHTSEDIKSVVTKEQFNSCKYVVERDK